LRVILTKRTHHIEGLGQGHTRIKRAPPRQLDRGAIGHWVRERHPQLDDIHTCGGHPLHQGKARVVIRVASHDEGNKRRLRLSRERCKFIVYPRQLGASPFSVAVIYSQSSYSCANKPVRFAAANGENQGLTRLWTKLFPCAAESPMPPVLALTREPDSGIYTPGGVPHLYN